MLKFIGILILLAAAGGGVYYLFSMERVDDIKVSGKLQISEQVGSFVSTSKFAEAPYFAVVKGKIKNNLTKPIKNVFIKYKIGDDITSATIFDLAPGQEISFNTRGVQTSIPNPDYNFIGLHYD